MYCYAMSNCMSVSLYHKLIIHVQQNDNLKKLNQLYYTQRVVSLKG